MPLRPAVEHRQDSHTFLELSNVVSEDVQYTTTVRYALHESHTPRMSITPPVSHTDRNCCAPETTGCTRGTKGIGTSNSLGPASRNHQTSRCRIARGRKPLRPLR